MERSILHCDINNCYASVEEMLNPELKNYKIAVAGSTDDRHGIVLAKNRGARACGVKTGETIWQARLKCPELIIVPPHFDEYVKVSKEVKRIYYSFTNRVESFGLDECFLDVTSTLGLFGTAYEIGEKIKSEVREKVGVTISVGISFNKTFAKLGSDVAGYDSIYTIARNELREKVWRRPTGELCGIGQSTVKRLHAMNIDTIGQLALADVNLLKKNLGVNGVRIWSMANGFENDEVHDYLYEMPIKSVGNGITLRADATTDEEVARVMLSLSFEVCTRLKNYKLLANGVALSIKNSSLKTKTFQHKLDYRTDSALEVMHEAMKLFNENYIWDENVRAITVRLMYLETNDGIIQTDMFGNSKARIKKLAADRAMYDINKKYNSDSLVTYCAMLNNDKLPAAHSDVVTLPGIHN